MEKSEKIKLALAIILFIFLLLQFRQRDKEVEVIKQNHSVYCGTILSIGWGKGGYVIIYQFAVDGKIIKPNGSCSKFTDNKFKNGIRSILVVTEKGKPEVHRLLESSDDFDKYNISPSDTLGLSCLHDYY